jgi:hypothetical protein
MVRNVFRFALPDPLAQQTRLTIPNGSPFEVFACDGFLETSSGPFGAIGVDQQMYIPRKWVAALMRPEKGSFYNLRTLPLWHSDELFPLPGGLVMWDLAAGLPMFQMAPFLPGEPTLHGFTLSRDTKAHTASAIASATLFSCIQPAPPSDTETQAVWPEM